MSRDNWEKIKYKIGEGLHSDSSSDGFTVKAPPQPDHGGEP